MRVIKMGALLLALVVTHASFAASADVELWRLDCGRFPDLHRASASDTFAYQNRREDVANSCYLIRHDREYLLWDTGFSMTAPSGPGGSRIVKGEALAAQLSRLQIKPEQISTIALSHGHADHLGQAAQFPHARLLMGKADLELASSQQTDRSFYDLSPWLAEGAKVEAIVGDRDIFGDGSVVMLSTPGHTLGHYSLLVRLPKTRPIILSGDLWSMADQVASSEMGTMTMNRPHALASMDRILKIAANLEADIIIQHEMSHIEKVPTIPASAR